MEWKKAGMKTTTKYKGKSKLEEMQKRNMLS